MKRYKHIVWDWNGTLMDDLWLCLDIVNKMLLCRGLGVVDRVRYREIFGFPLRDYCIRIGFDLKRDPFERLSDEFNDMYEMRRCECPLQEGVVDRLGEFKNEGIQHTLLSAYGQERLLEIVEFYGLSSLFLRFGAWTITTEKARSSGVNAVWQKRIGNRQKYSMSETRCTTAKWLKLWG